MNFECSSHAIVFSVILSNHASYLASCKLRTVQALFVVTFEGKVQWRPIFPTVSSSRGNTNKKPFSFIKYRLITRQRDRRFASKQHSTAQWHWGKGNSSFTCLHIWPIFLTIYSSMWHIWYAFNGSLCSTILCFVFPQNICSLNFPPSDSLVLWR